MIYNEELETMPREALRALQSKWLVALVQKVYYAVPYYRQKMEEAGVTLDDINSIDDIGKLPFTVEFPLYLISHVFAPGLDAGLPEEATTCS